MTSKVIEVHKGPLLCLNKWFSEISFSKSNLIKILYEGEHYENKIFHQIDMTSRVIKGHIRPLLCLNKWFS